MEDEAVKVVKKMANRDATLHATGLRIFTPVIAMVILLWIIYSGFEVATETQIDSNANSSTWGFHVGVITLLFGCLFLALGIPILINLFIKLSEQLQKQEETGIYQGADEKKSRSTVIIRIFVILITMCVLAWATYTGFRLATEPQRDGKYYPLAFPIGVVTILFGLVYGIIGLGIVGDLAICLIAQLMPKERKGIIIHQDRSNTDDKSVV
ncbi:uncharacterized protein LOC107426573 isoform X1 [Ziziphus jujuba]|uniref:Uncharacterized protein LOC107426573 isoform X1 n=1 Tax=Ziziphus jujuba TaxID=326968 RepID=A0ABM3ZSW0_ZIZJJ|nr:uncharacterized protein LOC107426573 isoform X1 [Ziziphus jujuba]